MKRTIVVLLAIMLMCVPLLTGCGSSNDDSSQASTDQVQEEITETEEEPKPEPESEPEPEPVIEYDDTCAEYESALAGHRYGKSVIGDLVDSVEFNSDRTYTLDQGGGPDDNAHYYKVAKIDGVYTVQLMDLVTIDKELRIQGSSNLPESLLNEVDLEWKLAQ